MGIQEDLIKYYGEIWQKMNQDIATNESIGGGGGQEGGEPLFAI
jgi:hypothetical protein